ncbi:helix-turn-helix domain-containing protein [Streptomyces yaizuensis]|uniref:LuxR family transcriptional regulator n=1 Tax=Streptomyces yaizuensis TaxID=2989713 RepID=A0ABQ5P1V0_9ACTN|nr:helix-turn-helix domain-containing protein [Streptomyces sp. YSPA8]GLF96588.1 LuxR family transcriptional regulator [Streptomyces sp. YSPA8]
MTDSQPAGHAHRDGRPGHRDTAGPIRRDRAPGRPATGKGTGTGAGAGTGIGAGADRAGQRLGALGVPPDEEFLYRALLAHPRATAAELAGATGWDTARVRRRTGALERRGLLTRAPGRPARYAPAPPEVAIELLALQRRAEIERARVAAVLLGQEFRAVRQQGQACETLSGREAVDRCFSRVQRTTRDELLVLDRAPCPAQRELLTGGVRCRAIYAHGSLETPEQLGRCRELARLGAESRVLAEVPLTLVVSDRRTALVPTGRPGTGEGDVLVLNVPALLEGLVILYELLWQRSVPLWPGGAGADGGAAGGCAPGPSVLSGDEEHLLALSASGLTDRAIARRLGVAQRTVERRMRRIMDALGARTRLQAGLQAARRGVLADPRRPR